MIRDRAGDSRPGPAGPSSRESERGAWRARLPVLGGIAAQMSQALGSLVLQIVAAHLLGAKGLGLFSVLYGVIVMTTAVCTGFVGDSLTVLDRSRPDIRSALQNWLVIVSSGGAVVAFAIAVIGGFLKPTGAVAFAAATAVFLVEDALRRLLMARLRFWRIVLVDLVSLAGSLITLFVAAGTGHSIGLGILMLSLFVGQLTAIAVAVLLLPRQERWLASVRPAALRAVFSYGSWRAAQQFLRPGMLTGMRLLVVAVVGLATVGELEAARIYTAPMLLVVTGASSFLFASYAASSAREGAALLHRADRGVVALFGGTIAMSVVAVSAMGFAAPLLVGSQIPLTIPAVVGWCVYAVALGSVTPYGALAAVRRRQAAVLGLRTADTVLSLVAVAVLLACGGDPGWVPLVLAGGTLLGGLAIRQLLLVRSFGTPGETDGAEPA